MSCTTCGPTPADSFCGPPVATSVIVAGPQGATGPIGPTGPQGYGPTGPAGATGPAGQLGPIGLIGPSGATGPAGSNSPPVAFFSGVVWNPGVPTDALAALTGGRTLDFGSCPMSSGTYLFSLKVQLGWNAGAGANTLNGTVSFADGTNIRQAFSWGRSKTGTSGFDYAVAEGMDLWFLATVTQGNELFLKSDPQVFLLGAQLTTFSPPTYSVTSPGFI